MGNHEVQIWEVLCRFLNVQRVAKAEIRLTAYGYPKMENDKQFLFEGFLEDWIDPLVVDGEVPGTRVELDALKLFTPCSISRAG